MATFPSKVNYATGDILTAANMNDVGGAINLLQGAQFAAGKNKIINGDFSVNQRNFTSTTTVAAYGFDRFAMLFTGGTCTYSAQTFTAGTAPVAGYEGKNFARLVTTGQSAAGDYAAIRQPIESVRTFAGQTVTFSFWAKASTGTPVIGVATDQYFGTGGSPSSQVTTSGGTTTITSSWARYTFTMSIPSITGKTIGTANNDYLSFWLFTSAGTSISGSGYPAVGIQNVTIDTWGWQVEAGSTVSNFQTATGTLQGELAACQRYYYRQGGLAAYQAMSDYGSASSTTTAYFNVAAPVTMRTIPTAIEYSTLEVSDQVNAGVAVTGVAFTPTVTSTTQLAIYISVASGLTQYRNYYLRGSNSTSAYLGFTAEL